MSLPDHDEPYQHGSTVLPGVPLPPSARPHQPAHPPAPTPAPPAPAPGAAPTPEPEAPATPEGPARTPWWKKQVGGAKKTAAPADAAPDVAEAPAPPPAPLPLPAPTSGPASNEPAPEPAGPTPDPAVATSPAAAATGRHAAAPSQPDAPAAGRSRALLLALVGVVVVLAAVAAFVWPGFLTASDDDAGGLGPTTPATTTASISLVTPPTIDGLRRFTGAADKTLAAAVEKGSVDGLSDPISAVYGKGTTPVVQVIAWHAMSPPATDTVTAAFTGYGGSTGAKVTALREVTVPGLAGHMECGLATVKKAATLQCFWADEFSVGSVTVLRPESRPAATSTAMAVRMAVEQKA